MMPKTTALAPMARANVTTAAKVKPGDLRNIADSEPHILHQRLNEMAAHRLVAFLFESLTGSKLDASLSLCPGAIKAGTFADRRHDTGCGSEALLPYLRQLQNDEGIWRQGSEGRPGNSYLLRPRGKGSGHGDGEAIPAFRLFAESLTARGGELIELGSAIVIRDSPTGF